MENTKLDLYTDYLLSTFGAPTATGLSAMLYGDISHDKITLFLSDQMYNTSSELWMKVKPTVKSLEDEKAVLIIDDTIQEKALTDKNELMCWHFDHCTGRNVRGINLLNALYYSNSMSIPVDFKLVKQPHQYFDIKTQQLKRKSKLTKNELMRNMFEKTIKNGLKFRFVLMDSWFSSAENFKFIISKNSHFITGLKSNRLVALTEEDRQNNRFI